MENLTLVFCVINASTMEIYTYGTNDKAITMSRLMQMYMTVLQSAKRRPKCNSFAGFVWKSHLLSVIQYLSSHAECSYVNIICNMVVKSNTKLSQKGRIITIIMVYNDMLNNYEDAFSFKNSPSPSLLLLW